MRPSNRAIAVFVLALTLSPALALADGLDVSDAWARETPPSAKAGAAYMTIRNVGDAVRRVVAVSSDAARRVEIHETITENGVMKMRPMPDLSIAPDGHVTLEPGGAHIMFMGLNEPFRLGTTVMLLLQLDDGSTVEVAAPVREVDAHMSNDSSHQGHGDEKSD